MNLVIPPDTPPEIVLTSVFTRHASTFTRHQILRSYRNQLTLWRGYSTTSAPMAPPLTIDATMETDHLRLYITTHLLPDSPVPLHCHVEFYIDNFISLAQGGPAYRRQVCDHVFHSIDIVLSLNVLDKHMCQ